MQNVGVETTQNVLIHYELASIGDRILACLLDWLIFLAYFFLIFIIISPIDFQLPWFVFLLLYLPVFFYHLVCEVFFNGQSPGKRQRKIKVMKLDGSRPGVGAYLLRWILRPVDFFMYGAVAMITVLLTGKGQRLGDLAAGTTVVRLKPEVDLSQHQVFKTSPEGYTINFPQVRQLNDSDISMVNEALEVYKETANHAVLDRMVHKVKSHLGIESNLPAVKFLYTIVRDYTHLNTQAQ